MASTDRLLYSALHGTAWRHASEHGSIQAAVEELTSIAGGRRDILAEAAGITAGTWSVSPGAHVGTELLVAGLLIYTGADLRALDHWVQVGRDRGEAQRHPVHG